MFPVDLWMQLSHVFSQLHRLVPKRWPGNQPQEEHPALHPQPEKEAQKEEDQVLSRV